VSCSRRLGGKFRTWLLLAPFFLTPALRILKQLQRRRPKNAPVVDTLLRRGHRNDGLIEIDNEEEQDDSIDFEDITISGVVYRLPERGIKLDFLDKVKQ
jgi:hypothetical protein